MVLCFVGSDVYVESKGSQINISEMMSNGEWEFKPGGTVSRKVKYPPQYEPYWSVDYKLHLRVIFPTMFVAHRIERSRFLGCVDDISSFHKTTSFDLMTTTLVARRTNSLQTLVRQLTVDKIFEWVQMSH